MQVLNSTTRAHSDYYYISKASFTILHSYHFARNYLFTFIVFVVEQIITHIVHTFLNVHIPDFLTDEAPLCWTTRSSIVRPSAERPLTRP